MKKSRNQASSFLLILGLNIEFDKKIKNIERNVMPANTVTRYESPQPNCATPLQEKIQVTPIPINPTNNIMRETP